jgi:hypothetical protein
MSYEPVVLDEVGYVTDHELITALRRLARADHALNAQLLVHLGEVEARGLYREYAHASMYTYCVAGCICLKLRRIYELTRHGWLGSFLGSCSWLRRERCT